MRQKPHYLLRLHHGSTDVVFNWTHQPTWIQLRRNLSKFTNTRKQGTRAILEVKHHNEKEKGPGEGRERK